MRRLRIAAPVVPALFAVFPLLSLFAENQTEVELSLIWWPLVSCVVAAIVLCGVFLLITKDASKATSLASLVVVALFYGGFLSAVWLVLLSAALLVIFRTRHGLGNLVLILGVAAAVLTVPQAAKVAIYQANHPSLSASDPRLWPTALEPPVLPAGARPPDIYMIVPDDYGRADILKQYFHYDDTRFIDQLKRRGFAISEQGRSSYSDSESNTAAAVNMDYLSNFPKVLGKTSQDGRPVKRVTENNRASRLLTSLGYDYVHIDTDEVTFAGGNPDISPLAPPDSFTTLWLQKTILRRVGGPLGVNDAATHERFRKSVGSEFDRLGAIQPGARPKFVFFHTLLPHDPYVFGARGQPVTFPSSSEDDLGSALGRRYYLSQLQYLQQKLLTAVDRIIARAKTPPVIVIQADEGFSMNPKSFGEAAAKDIRVKGLMAFRFPGLDRSTVPQPPNTVNTLRFVFNRYLGAHYPMLPSASYPETDLPYEFKEMVVK